MSGLPPPPLPPKVFETKLTKSTALIFWDNDFSMEITIDALSLILLIKQTMFASPLFIILSAVGFKSLTTKSSKIS